MDKFCQLNRFEVHYLTGLVADVPDDRLAEVATPGGTHPAWLLGHLAIAADYGLPLLGGQYLCPDAWHKTFAPGSQPRADRGLYPGKADLVAANERGYDALRQLAAAATSAQLAADQPVGFLKPWMLTVEDLVAHLLTTHLATHVGQLSAWRRQAGFAPISL